MCVCVCVCVCVWTALLEAWVCVCVLSCVHNLWTPYLSPCICKDPKSVAEKEVFGEKWLSDHIPWHRKYPLIVVPMVMGWEVWAGGLGKGPGPGCWPWGCILNTFPAEKSLSGFLLCLVSLLLVHGSLIRGPCCLTVSGTSEESVVCVWKLNIAFGMISFPLEENRLSGLWESETWERRDFSNFPVDTLHPAFIRFFSPTLYTVARARNWANIGWANWKTSWNRMVG